MGTVMQINANLKAIKSRLLGGGQAVWWEPDSWLDIIRNLEIQSLVCQLIRKVAIYVYIVSNICEITEKHME